MQTISNNEIKDIKEQVKDISYIAYEALAASNERREKRHVFLIALLIILLVATNAAWLIYESQMEKVTEQTTYTVEQDTDNAGNYNIIGGGEINGTSEDNGN